MLPLCTLLLKPGINLLYEVEDPLAVVRGAAKDLVQPLPLVPDLDAPVLEVLDPAQLEKVLLTWMVSIFKKYAYFKVILLDKVDFLWDKWLTYKQFPVYTVPVLGDGERLVLGGRRVAPRLELGGVNT